MKRLLFATAVALAAVSAHDVVAQPAAALGHPLPDGSLPAGTISVRVVAGSPSTPVTGTEVTLTVNNEPRIARTDAAGRAMFEALPPGATVQATIKDADDKPITSDAFPVPQEGGARIMLSTKPFTGMGGPGPAMGMPEARAMSGQPRPEKDDPAGTYTVRLTYNALKMDAGKLTDPQPPANTPVYLVAYAADDSITVTSKPTAPDGHASFDHLDVSGGTAYFMLANLPRNNATDRLIAVPAVPDPQGGVRAVLSGEKRDSTAAPIDDYAKLVPHDDVAVDANQVRVTLDGVPVDPSARVTLVDAITRKPIGSVAPHEGAPDPSQVSGRADFNPSKDLPAGTFEVRVKGGAGNSAKPMPGVKVLLADAKDQPVAEAEAAGATGMDGKVVLKTKPAAGIKAVLTINGKQMASEAVDLTTQGGVLEVTATWSAQGRPEAVFTVPYAPGQVMYAETEMSHQHFRSLPFLSAPEVGTHASIYIYPRTLFSFSVHSFLEDQLLAVQGTFEITNYSWAPYRTGPDGMLIKLPAGHVGGIIAPQDQSDVSVAAGEGFRIIRPIPPGGRKFRAGFSLPVEAGEVHFKLDLPLGTWQSGMEIRQTDNMKVTLPKGVQGETRTASTGEPWFVIDNITIERGQSMELTITGLPADAPWKTWVPRFVGLLVVLMLLGGAFFAIRRPPLPDTADTDARRQQLLDELVELEKAGDTTSHRRLQIMDELERMWGQ